MADPVLHEPTIIDTLDCTPSLDNVSRLQAACMLSLVDAYDRGLTRENFILLASSAMALHTQLGKLYLIDSVRENFRIGGLDETMLNNAVYGIRDMAGVSHDELLKLMRKVVMCPTTEDKVH